MKKEIRFQHLLDGMREGKTFCQIAEECGVSRWTIERDFWEWKESGGFEKWVHTEFMILHDRITQDDKSVVQAYRGMIELVKKYIINKVAVQGDVRIDLAWEELGSTSQSNIALTTDKDCSMKAKPDSVALPVEDASVKQSQAATKPSDKPSYAA